MTAPPGQIVRLVEADRPPLEFQLDGRPGIARRGDTVLTAILTLRGHLRVSEFGDGPCAGFCLMGACQDCWVLIDGAPGRACTSLAAEGMVVETSRGPLGG